MTQTTEKIPDEWNETKLGDLGEFFKGSGITKNDLVQEGVPCIRYAELYTKFNFTIPTCISFISENTAKIAKPIQKGDLLFAGSGETKEEIGKCAVYMGHVQAYAGGDNIIFRTSTALPLYLSFFLNTLGRKQLNTLGQGDSIVHIHSSDLKNVVIPLPPSSEQEKIAEILGTWDLAIEKLTALIEQKKQLKKGLMQRLLTGKQRLPGFSAPWNKVKLGEITCQISKNVGDLKIQTASISSKTGFVSQTEKFGRDISGEQYSKYTLIEKGDFSYNKGNSKTYPQGCAYRLKDFEKIAVPNAFISFKVKENILYPEFIEQFFIGNFHGRLLRKVITSSVRDNGLLNLNANDFFGLPISLPPLPEQNAIANILSKADEEITLLTRKLSALKEQKTGLMQKLLTGQIRVKVN